VVSVILYGGRITDWKDGQLFKVIMQSYLDDNKPPNYVFYPTNNDNEGQTLLEKEYYRIPDESCNQIQMYINHIKNFADVDPPGVFGLHGSADLTFRLKEFKEILDTIQMTLPTDGGSAGGISKEDDVKGKVKEFLINLPADFHEAIYRTKIDKTTWGTLGEGLKVPLNNNLLQEIMRIQGIIEIVKQSLHDITAALEGKLMMTEQIVSSINELFDAKPPRIWMYNANSEEISWLSPNAATWFEGLNQRAAKLKEWLESTSGTRPAFWVPGFFNPAGFIAAFKQEVFKYKKNDKQTGGGEITLDRVVLKWVPDAEEVDPKVYLANQKRSDNKDRFITIILYGLFLEGAIWKESLQDDKNTNSRTPIVKFPVIRVEGSIEETNKNILTSTTSQSYKCPLYKYPKRTDKYFIIEIGLKIQDSGSGGKDEKYCQKRGVALLCNQE